MLFQDLSCQLWRAIEAEDRALQVSSQRSYSQVFQDTFLNLFHAIVRFVENFLGMLEAQVVLSVFIPRQVYHGLQVVDEDRVVGALWVDGFELVQFLIERLGCSLVPFLVLGLFSQFFSLRILLVSPSSSRMFLSCCCRKYSLCCSSRSKRVFCLMSDCMLSSCSSLCSAFRAM